MDDSRQGGRSYPATRINMNYTGTIIVESLLDTGVLAQVKILSTKVEPVTKAHHTPWLKKWTSHKVEITEDIAREVAQKISLYLDYTHKSAWYADFKNDKDHYIIFKDKIFVVKKGDRQGYEQARKYGLSLGIPEPQVDFPQNI